MSVSGIASSLFSQFDATAAQSKFQQIKQGFQQLGQDLQSGNLAQAQSDFTALQQTLPGAQQTATAGTATAGTAGAVTTTSPLTQAVAQLAQDLQSGNLAAAQSDIATVQQDAQQASAPQGAAQGHHHHHGTASQDSSQSSSQQTAIQTLFSQLGQSLQTGNLAGAQQAYSTLQQDFLQSGLGSSSAGSSTSATGSSAVNISI
jgi:outer membrane protein assembly factor BamD (BamD/ComL family)